MITPGKIKIKKIFNPVTKVTKTKSKSVKLQIVNDEKTVNDDEANSVHVNVETEHEAPITPAKSQEDPEDFISDGESDHDHDHDINVIHSVM